MKLFKVMKDGGYLSRVWGLFFVELKSLFSIVGLKFLNGSREAYHSHAFNALSWVLKGQLIEQNLDGSIKQYGPSIIPIWTPRDRFHKVTSLGTTYVLSFRGPWVSLWSEYTPGDDTFTILTHGRKVVA